MCVYSLMTMELALRCFAGPLLVNKIFFSFFLDDLMRVHGIA